METDPNDPNAINYRAFDRERPDLLAMYPGGFAAYHNGARVAVGNDRNAVYREARDKIGLGLIMVQPVVRKEDEPVIRLRSPRSGSSPKVV